MKSSDQSHGVVFHAGFPNAGEDELSSLSLDQLVFKHPASTFLWRLSESIEDLNWPAGATVVVDRSLAPRTGDRVVAVIEEEFAVRIYRDGYLHKPGGDREGAENLSLWGVITNLLVSYR
ncbi:MAG TPA: S24 family peptidase [Candidatus Saccharimonadales bacterium]|nr:S24 family peptidase [Candidatus Saccharimonadales bacterium]